MQLRLSLVFALAVELAARQNRASKPDLSGLSADERRLVENACMLESVQGPEIYYRCLRNQLASRARSGSKPDLSGLSADERRLVENACMLESVQGPEIYYHCLRNQLASLNSPGQRVQNPPSIRMEPQPTPAVSNARPASRRSSWPQWGADLSFSVTVSGLSTVLQPADIYKRVSSSVYAVLARGSGDSSGGDVALGSAVAVSTSTLITNCHLFDVGSTIVVVKGETIIAARLSKSDPASDRCVLEVQQNRLSPVKTIRRYGDLAIGERVYSIGTPRGLEGTMGEGIISGLRKDQGVNLIQTTAQISPGSSGGGLFDSSGNLIGITTFMLRDTQSLNFALAVDEFAH